MKIATSYYYIIFTQLYSEVINVCQTTYGVCTRHSDCCDDYVCDLTIFKTRLSCIQEKFEVELRKKKSGKKKPGKAKSNGKPKISNKRPGKRGGQDDAVQQRPNKQLQQKWSRNKAETEAQFAQVASNNNQNVRFKIKGGKKKVKKHSPLIISPKRNLPKDHQEIDDEPPNNSKTEPGQSVKSGQSPSENQERSEESSSEEDPTGLPSNKFKYTGKKGTDARVVS